MGIFSIIGDVVGGLFGRKSEEKQQKRQINAARDADTKSRQQYLADRINERDYAAKTTAADRRYTESLTAKDRAYAEKLLFGERDYARKISIEDRAYNERMLGKDRQYAEKVYAKELADAERSKLTDAAAYRKDRRNMQALADKQAIRTAASRGIDFERLRDDAVKAGFNPLTAMQWASAYNTEQGFGVMGDVYSGSASTPSQVQPGSRAGGSTVASGGGGGSTPVVGSIMPGAPAIQTSGLGYGASTIPSFMSADLGASIGSAIDTGLNWWSHKDDAKYQEIADQVARGQLAREYEHRTPRNFGYSLTKIEPFRPTLAVGVPALAGTTMAPAAGSDSMMTPPRTGMPTAWGELRPSGAFPDQEAVEARYGGAVGEVMGAASFARDLWRQEVSKPVNDYMASILRPSTVRPRPRPGSGSYALTGSYPIAPLMGAYAGF